MESSSNRQGFWFVWGAIALVVIFGTFTLVTHIQAASPQVRLQERLAKSDKFAVGDSPWNAEWSLQGMEDAPWATVSHAQAKDVDLFDGVTIINFWATWCEPCKAELPSMFKLARELKGPKLHWVFVSYDGSWTAPDNLLKRVQTSLPKNVVMLRDPVANAGGTQSATSLMNKMGTEKLPETYFVEDGHVFAKIVGAINWTHADIREYLQLLVGK